MTKQQALEIFKEEVVPSILKREGGRKDKPLRRESWNNFVDGLNRDGQVSDSQADNWTQPAFCK